MTFEFPIRAGASLLVAVALLIAACSRPGSTAGTSALKPIDQAAPAADKPIDILKEGFGYACVAHFLECYFSLIDAENVRGTGALNTVKHHLEAQTRVLQYEIAKWEAIQTAYPDDTDLLLTCPKLKETATALLAQNTALQEYLSGQSKDLEKIHTKRAASRLLLNSFNWAVQLP